MFSLQVRLAQKLVSFARIRSFFATQPCILMDTGSGGARVSGARGQIMIWRPPPPPRIRAVLIAILVEVLTVEITYSGICGINTLKSRLGYHMIIRPRPKFLQILDKRRTLTKLRQNYGLVQL